MNWLGTVFLVAASVASVCANSDVSLRQRCADKANMRTVSKPHDDNLKRPLDCGQNGVSQSTFVSGRLCLVGLRTEINNCSLLAA